MTIPTCHYCGSTTRRMNKAWAGESLETLTLIHACTRCARVLKGN